MLNLNRDIHPVTDFKRNTTRFMKQMRKTKQPLVLTVNGKAALIVQDAESYQRILDRLERLEFVEAVRAGMKDEEEGRTVPALKALRQMKANVDLQR